MTDYYILLGISEGASPDQIKDAFDKKKAELIASIDDQQKLEMALLELEEAYAGITKNRSLALTHFETPQKVINPLLSMVDEVNSPTHNEPSQFTTISCVYCGAKNLKEALICGSCGRHISIPCPKCGKVLSIEEKICPRCKTILREFNESRIYESTHVKEVMDTERKENQIRVEALEEHHKKKAVYGLVFWLVVVAVFVGLCLFVVFLLPLLGLRLFN